ncbi:DUF5683 domain-containing protein [Mucilaginibacter agri]|nr:DUF5683 domain-containing protein [Mucilaginibacter agri]
MAQRPDFGNRNNPKDSLNRVRDSISSKPFVPNANITKVYHPDSLHSPHKAFVRSAIIPGWGQLYNHRWWKVPIIYGGFALLGAAIVYNNHYYHEYVNEGNRRFRGETAAPDNPYVNIPGGYQQFYDAASANQRNLQLSILGGVLLWGINCVDAYIDGKFIHSYSVDNNLSIRVAPSLLNQPMYASTNINGYIPGVKITLGF